MSALPPPRPARPRPRTVKVVVTGADGAGKTTFIRTISEITVLSTEPSPAGAADDRTTVAMDFGRITIAPDLALYLFGTPAKEGLELLWDVVADGMLGFLLMVDASDADALEEARRIRSDVVALADVPALVAVNKIAGDPTSAVAEVRAALELPDHVPVVATDALDRETVRRTLLAFLGTVLEHVQRPGPDHAASTGDTG